MSSHGMLNRHDVAAWLLRNGFEEQNTGSGHVYFRHAKSGVKIVLPGHGPNDLSRKVAGNVIRSIVSAGFDRAEVRLQLHGVCA